MISITDKAAGELRVLLDRKGAGPELGLRLAKNVQDIVAELSTGKLAGCRLDYTDDLSDAGCRIDNPNAARSCGCGTSFETSREPTPEPEDCGKN